ncbi:hypothetical protein [Methylobacterium variabile]|jgi:hypothetical protein|uniref:hypothetical protein n=1 Tax=Methylobacterium variabile TaxID=298794 RepID=UPI000A820484|nr:hypothetical protein [Methylobacterium variabile]
MATLPSVTAEREADPAVIALKISTESVEVNVRLTCRFSAASRRHAGSTEP